MEIDNLRESHFSKFIGLYKVVCKCILLPKRTFSEGGELLYSDFG